VSIELLLFVLVFFGPGAALIFSWDLAGMRRKRPQSSFLGWSFTISSFVYAGLQAVGMISISTILKDGALNLERMVETSNATLYLVLVIVAFAAGFFASLTFHSVEAQARLAKLMGRSWRESVWHGIAADLPNRWVQLVMENGDIWEGGIAVVSPDLAEGVVALQRSPRLWRRHDEHSPYSPVEMTADQTTLRLCDVKAFYAFPREDDPAEPEPRPMEEASSPPVLDLTNEPATRQTTGASNADGQQEDTD